MIENRLQIPGECGTCIKKNNYEFYGKLVTVRNKLRIQEKYGEFFQNHL